MSPRRLYLDNAATSFPKPRTVLEAMNRYAMELGASAGRGAYVEAIESGKLIETCRRRLNQLFNGGVANQFVFTLNCTEALNLAIKGLIDPRDVGKNGGHAICTAIDHNSILRPLTALVERGWIESQTRMPVDAKTGLVDPDDIRRAIRPDTKLIAITHVSNVTGTVQPIREIGAIARERGIPFIVDAAQSAGHLPIDLAVDHIDLLAAPGHKGLLGPLGTGFLYIRPGLETRLMPLVEGGTGSISEEPRQPEFMPDRFESGSHNAIGIAGLSEGVKWIRDQGIERVAAHEMDLVRSFLEGMGDIEGLTYFGPQGVKNRTGVFSVRIDGIAPHELSAILEAHYGILTRSGLHCAPFAHETIGTLETGGTTRFSFGPFLVLQDIKFVTDAVAEIAGRNAECGMQNADSKAQN
ncbi:MAG: aminotransferase class V-fold PLP-dependent enzyme [Anaerolineae bacterium]|nr:aminotransferase class V-fold PLP-dependent enzyme [Phycisphaerae bacterium]